MIGYIVIALVIIITIVLSILYFRDTRVKKEEKTEPADELIAQAFEVIDHLPNNDELSGILIKQQPVEARLAELFDELFDRGHTFHAEKIAHLLTKSQPENPDSFFRLGISQMKLERYDDAEASFRKSLELNPDNIHSANNLAYILNKKGLFAQSVLLLERFAESNNVITLVNLGIAKYYTGDIEFALDLLNSAYKKDMKRPEIHFYLGKCLEALGEKEKAMMAFERYKTLLKEEQEEQPTSTENIAENKKEIDNVQDNYDEGINTKDT